MRHHYKGRGNIKLFWNFFSIKAIFTVSQINKKIKE